MAEKMTLETLQVIMELKTSTFAKSVKEIKTLMNDMTSKAKSVSTDINKIFKDIGTDSFSDEMKELEDDSEKMKKSVKKDSKEIEQGLDDIDTDTAQKEIKKLGNGSERMKKDVVADANQIDREFDNIDTNSAQAEIQQLRRAAETDLGKISSKMKNAMLEMQNACRSPLQSIGKMVSGVLSPILGAAAITGIIGFGKASIEVASDLQEAQNVVDVTFGSMSDKVEQFADTAIEQFGLAELETKNYMGTTGAMAKSFGFNSQEVYDMSEAITSLTGDVSSFYNLEHDEAYTKLKAIFTGETESLKDLGIVMTQTALDQYAMNNGFGKTTAKMTEQEKVMLRYQFVMSGLASAGGDFARTSESWANQTRILSLRFQELKASIGTGLISVFTPAIGYLNTLLGKLASFAKMFSEVATALFGSTTAQTTTSKTVSPQTKMATGGIVDKPIVSLIGEAGKEAVIPLENNTQWIDELAGDIVSRTGIASESKATLNAGIDMQELSDALRTADDTSGILAANMTATADAAEDAKRQLFGFDEMTKLAADAADTGDTGDIGNSGSDGNGDGSSGSGESGSDDSTVPTVDDLGVGDMLEGLDTSSGILGEMSEQVSQISEEAAAFAQKIRDAFNTLREVSEPTLSAIKKLWNEGLSKLGNFTWDTIKDFWNNFLKPMGMWYLSDDSGLPRFFNITNDLLNEINWTRLNQSLENYYTALQKPAQFKWNTLMDFYESFLKPLSVWTLGDGIPRLLDATTKMNNEIDWNRLRTSLNGLYSALEKMTQFTFDALITFYTNFLVPIGTWVMSDAIPRLSDAVTGLLNAIDWDELNKALGDLFTALSIAGIGIGQGFVDFFSEVADDLKPAVASSVSAMADAIKRIADIIGGMDPDLLHGIGEGIGFIAEGFLVFKGLTWLGGRLLSIKLGMSGLLSVLGSHPLAAIGTGMIMLPLGLGALHEVVAKTGFADDVKKAAQAVDDITEAMEELEIANEVDYTNVTETLDKFMELNEKLKNGGLSEADKTLYSQYYEELKEYAPEIEKIIGDINEGYDGTREAIQKIIDKQKEQYLVTGYKDVLTSIGKEMAENEIAQKKLMEERDKFVSETSMGTQGAYNLSLLNGNGGSVSYFGSPLDHADKAKINNYTSEINSLKESYQALAGEAEYCGTKIQELTGRQEEGTTATSNYKNEAESGKETVRTVGTEIEAAKEVVKSFTDATNDVDFAAFVGRMAASVDSVHGIWVNGKQILGTDAIAMYNEIMAGLQPMEDGSYQLANGTVVRLGTGFADGKEGFISIVSDIALSGKGEIESYYSAYQEASTELGNSVSTGFESKKTGFLDNIVGFFSTGIENVNSFFASFKDAGKYLAQGAQEGVEEEKPNFFTSLRNFISGGLINLDEEAEINSPSRKTMRSGEFIGQGLINGVNSIKESLMSLMREIPVQMIASMGTLTVMFSAQGFLIGTGLKLGLNIGWAAARSEFAAIPGKIKEAIGDLTGIGRDAAQSLANGFRSVHIPSPHFSVGTIAAEAAGRTFALPRVDVSWFAKGGIVNEPTLSMIGEAGKEAVIPLENNTQWIDSLAARVAAQSQSGGSESEVVRMFAELLALIRSRQIVTIDEEALRKYFIKKTNANKLATGVSELK